MKKKGFSNFTLPRLSSTRGTAFNYLQGNFPWSGAEAGKGRFRNHFFNFRIEDDNQKHFFPLSCTIKVRFTATGIANELYREVLYNFVLIYCCFLVDFLCPAYLFDVLKCNGYDDPSSPQYTTTPN